MEHRLRITVWALAAALTWLVAPFRAASVAADHISGTFERCAEVTDFVAPGGGGDGYLTLLGIGPGAFNPIDDAAHHTFPFAAGTHFDPGLVAKLTGLAAADHFTCLRMRSIEDDTQRAVITELTVLATKRLCPAVAKNHDGNYTVTIADESWTGELIGEAKALIGADRYLTGWMDLLVRMVFPGYGCLNLAMDAGGVLQTLTADIKVSPCGRVEVKQDLVVSGVLVADADSKSTDLLPAKVRTATLLLSGSANEACVGIDVVASQWSMATISMDGRWCGVVTRSPSEVLEIDGVTIASNLLTSKQTTQLAAVVGGYACLRIQINTNVYSAELSELAVPFATTAPSPSELSSPLSEPTAVPAPTLGSPSATPSPTALAVAPRPAATIDDGGAATGFLLIGIIVLAAGAVGAYVLYRRRRDGEPVRHVSPATGGDSMAAAAAEPEQTSISLTPREGEVVDMLLEGFSNKEIATRLFISESTAGVHVSNVMTKLGAHSRSEAAAIAHRLRLRQPGPFAN